MTDPEPNDDGVQRTPLTPADAGRSAERFLRNRLGMSRDHAVKLLRQGRVRVGEQTLTPGEPLPELGQQLEVHPRSGERSPPMPNRRIRLSVLHTDDDLLVIAKPAGAVVHPGPGHGTDTLLNGLIGAYPGQLELGAAREWGLVHRLDRETSGPMVIARTVAAYEHLVRAFSERRIKKEYLALVGGQPAEPTGEVATAIDGKDALTRYALEQTVSVDGHAVSRVRLWPVTGRTHQVRIHLAQLGSPVLGDARHGPGRDHVTGRLYLARLGLHAARLELTHPRTGDPLVAEQPLPKDMRRAWQRAVKLAAAGGTPERETETTSQETETTSPETETTSPETD